MLELNSKQNCLISDLGIVDGFVEYTEKFLSETELNDEQFNDVRKQAREILKQYKKDLTDKYRGISTKQEIELFMKEKEQAIQDLMKSKKEEIKESKLLRQEND